MAPSDYEGIKQLEKRRTQETTRCEKREGGRIAPTIPIPIPHSIASPHRSGIGPSCRGTLASLTFLEKQ